MKQNYSILSTYVRFWKPFGGIRNILFLFHKKLQICHVERMGKHIISMQLEPRHLPGWPRRASVPGLTQGSLQIIFPTNVGFQQEQDPAKAQERRPAVAESGADVSVCA